MKNFKAEQKKYACAMVTETGGSVVAENAWGLKSLAYPIRRRPLVFTGLWSILRQSDFNEKLKIQLLRDESVSASPLH
jgi:small subunit ribosomal protein S6